MATVKGNVDALHQVASELFPPVRSGQAAELDQDTAGPPFATRDLDVTGSYDLANPSFTAPAWVYGLTLDSCESGSSVYVAFGSSVPGDLEANPQSPTGPECTLVPGQTITFPRGARRVFLRASVSQVIRVTWTLDRFADKRFGCPCESGGGGIVQTIQAGAGIDVFEGDPANPIVSIGPAAGPAGNVLTSDGAGGWISAAAPAPSGAAGGVLRGTYPDPSKIGPNTTSGSASFVPVDGPLPTTDKVFIKGANLQPVGVLGGYNAETLIFGGDGVRGPSTVDAAGAAVLAGGKMTNFASPVPGGDAYVTGGASSGPGGTGASGNVWIGFKIPTYDPNAGKWDTVDASEVHLGKPSGSGKRTFLQEQEFDLGATPHADGLLIGWNASTSKWVPVSPTPQVVTAYSGLHHKTNTTWEQIGAVVVTGTEWANRTVTIEGTGIIATAGDVLEVQLVNLATAAVVAGPLQFTTTNAAPVSISGAAIQALGNVALGVEIRMTAGGASGYVFGVSLHIT